VFIRRLVEWNNATVKPETRYMNTLFNQHVYFIKMYVCYKYTTCISGVENSIFYWWKASKYSDVLFWLCYINILLSLMALYSQIKPQANITLCLQLYCSRYEFRLLQQTDCKLTHQQYDPRTVTVTPWKHLHLSWKCMLLTVLNAFLNC